MNNFLKLIKNTKCFTNKMLLKNNKADKIINIDIQEIRNQLKTEDVKLVRKYFNNNCQLQALDLFQIDV